MHEVLEAQKSLLQKLSFVVCDDNEEIVNLFQYFDLKALEECCSFTQMEQALCEAIDRLSSENQKFNVSQLDFVNAVLVIADLNKIMPLNTSEIKAFYDWHIKDNITN